ncbi:MAG: sugar phosphate isomerase/epimerase [Rhodobacteraceae bacterium]|nr:sugar phosphate isomerase/epimerase [Paracoccaceae bacterium]
MIAAGRLVSVSHLTAIEARPEDFIDHAAAAGFDAVGLRTNPPAHTPDHWPVTGDLPRARALRHRADAAGIKVFEAETFSIWPDFSLESLLPGLEVAGILGAQMLVAAGIDADEARMIDSYGQLADAAAGFGLTIGIEFMPFRPLKSLNDAARVQRAVARPNARILIDALHLSRSGSGPEAVAQLDPARIAYLHLCDAEAAMPADGDFAREARTARHLPGGGGLPLLELLAAVPPDLPVSVEAPDPNHGALPDAEKLRRCAKATRALFARLPELA